LSPRNVGCPLARRRQPHRKTNSPINGNSTKNAKPFRFASSIIHFFSQPILPLFYPKPEASQKVAGKNPTPKNPPVGISTKGLKKWEGFCKKYQSTWKDYTKIEDKWKVAIAIWIKYAIKHNFPPFNETTDETNQNIVDMLTNRIESNIKTALKAANTFCNMLIRKGFGSKALLDTVYQVEEVSPGKYQIIFRRKITKGDSLKNKDFISFIKARKFAVKQSVYSRAVSTMCTLYLFEEDDELYLESRFICTAQLVSSLLHFDSKSMSKKTVVIKELTKVFKSKLRECRS
jgi:hypothetical protein